MSLPVLMIGCTLMLLWYYLEHQCTIYTRTSTTIQPAKTQQYAAASYLGCQYVPSHPQPLLSYYTDCWQRFLKGRANDKSVT
ncbi:unnamed protein product [Brugia pahangi]|uniref:Secreted protein n=1 Tax=Brugia pahangi TaxID=6280 RepID=A0A0N4TQV4_BRUPA|nr:unnamed protein product [Brugia pahangi]